MRKTTFSVLLWLLCLSAQAQQLSGIMIEDYFNNKPLDQILTTFGKKYQLKISYDTALVSTILVTHWFHEVSAEEAFDYIARKYKLRYYLDEQNVLHFVDLTAALPSASASRNFRYEGPPQRFNLTVTGVVRDKESGETLPYANVRVRGAAVGSPTNIDGYFTLLKVPTDTSALIVKYIGYQTGVFYLRPDMDSGLVVIEIEPEAYQIETVEVVAEREALLETNDEVSLLKMSPAKIALLPNVGEHDIMRAFQLMPGISAANENSSGLYVRGGTPDQSLVTYDGFTVYHVDHLYGFFSAFNPNAIKDVQLYKGGFEARFGGRLSSVAEITGKEGNRKNFNIGGDIGLLSANVFAEAPIGDKFTVLVAARRSWRSPIYNKIFERFSGESEQPTGPMGGGAAGITFTETKASSFFYDLNGKVTYRPNEKDLITLSVYNGTDKMDNSRELNLPSFAQGLGIDFDNSIVDLTRWGNTGGSLKWSRKWSERFYGNSLISYSSYFSERDRSAQGTITDAEGNETTFKNGTLEDNNLKDFSFRSDYEWKPISHHQIGFGTQITRNRIQYSYSQNDTSTIIDRDDTGMTYAAYVQDRIQLLNNRITLTPGLRYTYFGVTGGNYFEPRFSTTINLTKRLKLKGAYGKYYQFAKRVIREDILQGSRDFWVLADNDKLPVGSSIHYIAGASYETSGFLFDVEAYYKELSGLSEYSLRFTPSFRELSYEENFFEGTGTARGIDVLIQKKYGKLNGWISYSIGEVLNQYDVYGEKAFYAANDVRHELKLVGIYKWKQFDFSATWIYASGRPYTAPEGGYQITLLDGSTQDFINVSAKNGLRLPDYHRLDLAATYNWKTAAGSPCSIGFSLFNAYNRKNVWYKEYEIVEGQVIGTNVNYLGITPNLSFSYKLK
ncbi:MAG: TonB-dependent receptor [Bacteroidetes bacterium]|nr:MAG: TonB-dependent receptor [Bacteroidota bacterium]